MNKSVDLSAHSTGLDSVRLLKTDQVCLLMGGIHPRTLLRLEKRGLIRCVPGLLRHKLYCQADVISLIENLKNWKV